VIRDREGIQPAKKLHHLNLKGSLVKQMEEENSGNWPTQVHLEKGC